ncbi:SDR family NAD(P)-dependent oxidoreductase [Legionella spiritensis]|uniref:Short-chain dehydrogenase/reductase n=1 Tax=Legionella spiritensis TaxID=452 RepID=A0A0W0YX28_LEGSP|nr:SDR family NAD(P)-dependent oxidoreductase [Legionella spiritensis]KTD61166.1 short-chain dehydrogenase/reductase [Legionella spiritensis]SNV45329.1 short-chain dehydrogenase/reductase [Legionella spiritensis]
MAKENNKETPNIALVTGADSGLGFETAKRLAAEGFHVIMAGIRESEAQEAIKAIRNDVPAAILQFEYVDLGSMNSVKRLCDRLLAQYDNLSLLVNNAGVNDTPYRITKDGFEATFQINYLGHVLLTQRLLPLLEANGNARIVHVTSYGHHYGSCDTQSPLWQKISPENQPECERQYHGIKAYFNSKLAVLLFHNELARRFNYCESSVKSIAVHPGSARTQMLKQNPWANCQHSFFQLSEQMVGQTPAEGARPTLHACLHSDVKNGDFYGPDGILELRGSAKLVRGSRDSESKISGYELWNHTMNLLRIDFNLDTDYEPEYDFDAPPSCPCTLL